MSDDKQPGRTEIIRWRDARSEDAWTEQEDIEMRVADITTVGFAASETQTLLCIASSWERRTNQFCGMMFIPKECILDRRYLNPAEEETVEHTAVEKAAIAKYNELHKEAFGI